MENYIVSFTTVLILFGLYKLFGRLLPLDKAEYKTEKTVEELRKKYLRFDLKQLGVFVLLTVGLIFILFKLFSALVDLRLSLLSDVKIIVKPYPEMLFIISLFSGMLLGSLTMFAISKRQLKTDWDEYLAYSNLKYKFNYVKVSKYTVRIFAFITGLLIIAFLDWYSAFGQQEIKINGLISIGAKTYKYSDIAKVKDIERLKAPNGNIVNDPHFIIEFTDGEKWNSRENGFANYNQDSEIIDLITTKTKIEPIELEFDNE
jgi:hypothetical protein